MREEETERESLRRRENYRARRKKKLRRRKERWEIDRERGRKIESGVENQCGQREEDRVGGSSRKRRMVAEDEGGSFMSGHVFNIPRVGGGGCGSLINLPAKVCCTTTPSVVAATVKPNLVLSFLYTFDAEQSIRSRRNKPGCSPHIGQACVLTTRPLRIANFALSTPRKIACLETREEKKAGRR